MKAPLNLLIAILFFFLVIITISLWSTQTTNQPYHLPPNNIIDITPILETITLSRHYYNYLNTHSSKTPERKNMEFGASIQMKAFWRTGNHEYLFGKPILRNDYDN